MECPYCAEDIKNEAIVCKNCGRDLKIVLPVILEIRQITSELDVLQRSLDRVEMQLAFREAPLLALIRHGAIYVVPLILLLVVAHYLIIVAFNLSPLWLRIASLLIPLPFGVAASGVGKIGLRSIFFIGLLIAVLSVAEMLTIIGVIDGVPIVPVTWIDGREAAEYCFSIALAFLTGGIITHLMLIALPATINGGDRPSQFAIRLARALGGHTSSEGLR